MHDRGHLTPIPEQERAKSVVYMELERLPTQNALGLKWNIEDDEFVWEATDKLMSATSKIPVTKRGMVSVVYSLFHPLGFLVPYIMKAKLLLKKLREIRVERCFKPKEFGKVEESQ